MYLHTPTCRSLGSNASHVGCAQPAIALRVLPRDGAFGGEHHVKLKSRADFSRWNLENPFLRIKIERSSAHAHPIDQGKGKVADPPAFQNVKYASGITYHIARQLTFYSLPYDRLNGSLCRS